MTAVTWRHRLLLVLLGLAAYWPVLRVGFEWDDHFTIEANPAIRSWSVENLRHDFTTGLFNSPSSTDFYRPLQTLSDRIDFSLWGERPFGYHLTNLAFHLLSALLVTELLVAIGIRAPAGWLTGCLFAVHPVIVSELLMVTGRAEPMSFAFSLLALLCLLREERWAWAVGAGAFLLAVFSKESGVMTFVYFGLAVFAARRNARTLLRLGWLIAPLGVYLWLYHRAIRH